MDRIRTQLLHSLVHTITDGVVVIDANGRIVLCNDAIANLLGMDRERILGATVDSLECDAYHEDGSPFRAHEHPATIALATGKACRNVVMGLRSRAAATWTWINISSSVIRADNCSDTYVLAVYSAHAEAPWPETERRQLRDLAWTDPLTGLANRLALGEAMDREIARNARSGHAAALLLIDVDHFKRFNDRYGHTSGDLALVTVARTLRDATSGTDLVARYGGEEFVVLLRPGSYPAALQMAHRIRGAIAAAKLPPPLAGARLSVSIGCSSFALWDTCWQEPFSRADAALYRAKAAGRNCVCMEDWGVVAQIDTPLSSMQPQPALPG